MTQTTPPRTPLPQAPPAAAAPSPEGMMAAVTRAAPARGLPPVHLWNPPFCGDLDIRIARDGSWHYLGTPIGREPLVRLFASILKIEEGRYYLVTPVEKVGITVEDLPLQAVDVDARGEGRTQVLTFTTRTGDVVEAGADHPIRMDPPQGTAPGTALSGPDHSPPQPERGGPAPAVMVRNGLWARIDRKSFFRLADLGCHEQHDGDSWFGLWSQGIFFPVILSKELA